MVAQDKILSVVMPVYNEEKTLREIASRVLREPAVGELIIVDDGSTDSTWMILEELQQANSQVRSLRHSVNLGKGAGIRTGIKIAKSPLVMIQDADLEYDPAEYSKLIDPILSNQADVVFGSRFMGASAHRVLYFWHYAGNKLLTLLSNMATDLNLTDMECCYKVFRREMIQGISISENGFGVEPELVAKTARQKVRIYEVSVSYHGRTYEEGKKVRWIDGIRALWCILKYHF